MNLHIKFDSTQYSITYSISQASFQQLNQSKTFSRQYDLSSPYSVEFLFKHFFQEKPYQVGGAIFYSGYSQSNTTQGEVLAPKPDYGINSFFQYDDYKNKNSYSFGLEYETLFSINLDSLESTAIITSDKNTVTYFNLAFSKDFQLIRLPLYIKLQLSKSLTFQRTTSGIENPNSIGGWKSLILLSTPIGRKWSLHLFQKYFQFSGGESFKILRHGAGVGYVF